MIMKCVCVWWGTHARRWLWNYGPNTTDYAAMYVTFLTSAHTRTNDGKVWPTGPAAWIECFDVDVLFDQDTKTLTLKEAGHD